MDNGKLETVPPGTVHLDTVRTLHQTVVSLRTALEISKNELKELKEKYQEHSRCIEYTDIIEKLALENHILRRRIIDSGVDRDTKNINLEVSYTPKTGHTTEYCDSEVVIKTASTLQNIHEDIQENIESHSEEIKSPERLEEILEESKSESIASENLYLPDATSSPKQGIEEPEPISEVSIPKEEPDSSGPNFKTKLELLSKFDVKIKVRTVKEGTVFSSTSSESDSTVGDKKEKEEPGESRASFQFEEHREHFENLKTPKGDTINLKSASGENIKMAVPNEAEVKSKTDKFDVRVRITSEENLVVKESTERARRKDTLNLDVDNLSLR